MATKSNPNKNPAAVALGRLGGLKGGPALAAKMTPAQRKAAGRKAALARWSKKSKKPWNVNVRAVSVPCQSSLFTLVEADAAFGRRKPRSAIGEIDIMMTMIVSPQPQLTSTSTGKASIPLTRRIKHNPAPS
jgi:hypothetical protein